jgi:hypothetical protein
MDVKGKTKDNIKARLVITLLCNRKNSKIHVFDDSLVDVDAEEFNVVLSSSGQENVNEDDDDDDIHIEDCDGADDNSIDDKEEEENSD